jgi:hypothetical protein
MSRLFVLLMLVVVVVAGHAADADPIPLQRPSAGPCPAGPERIGEPTAPLATMPGWPARDRG